MPGVPPVTRRAGRRRRRHSRRVPGRRRDRSLEAIAAPRLRRSRTLVAARARPSSPAIRSAGAALEGPQGHVPVGRRGAQARHERDLRGHRRSDRRRWRRPRSTCRRCSAGTATRTASSSGMPRTATCTSSSRSRSTTPLRSGSTRHSASISSRWWSASTTASLKAEHGTGRNMAPFVETEWGPDGVRRS